MRTRRTVAVVSLLIGLMNTTAESRRWWGDAGDNDWFDPDNWNPAGIPAPPDSLCVLCGSPQTTQDVDVDMGGGLFFDNMEVFVSFGDLCIGRWGYGRSYMSDQPTVWSRNVCLGKENGSEALAEVRSWTTWDIDGHLPVGSYGTATLYISASALLGKSAIVGEHPGSEGLVKVRGYEFGWTNFGRVHIGGDGAGGGHGVVSLLYGGTLIANQGVNISSTGELHSADGLVVGNVINEGLVRSHRHSYGPAILSIDGNYLQGADGAFLTQLSGTGSGEFGRMSVTGTAELNGALRIDFLGGFAPTVGDTFDILTGPAISGTFETVERPYMFDVIYGSTGVTLLAVLPGDLNGDGLVSQIDLDIVLDHWGSYDPLDPRADLNADGFVGQTDLDIILDNWGRTAGAADRHDGRILRDLGDVRPVRITPRMAFGRSGDILRNDHGGLCLGRGNRARVRHIPENGQERGVRQSSAAPQIHHPPGGCRGAAPPPRRPPLERACHTAVVCGRARRTLDASADGPPSLRCPWGDVYLHRAVHSAGYTGVLDNGDTRNHERLDVRRNGDGAISAFDIPPVVS